MHQIALEMSKICQLYGWKPTKKVILGYLNLRQEGRSNGYATALGRILEGFMADTNYIVFCSEGSTSIQCQYFFSPSGVVLPVDHDTARSHGEVANATP